MRLAPGPVAIFTADYQLLMCDLPQIPHVANHLVSGMPPGPGAGPAATAARRARVLADRA
jgi:hypothetical protein